MYSKRTTRCPKNERYPLHRRVQRNTLTVRFTCELGRQGTGFAIPSRKQRSTLAMLEVENSA